VANPFQKHFFELALFVLAANMPVNAQVYEKPPREIFQLTELNQPKLVAQLQKAATAKGDILYVHGATFLVPICRFLSL
jgi:hypothetical protein